MAIFAASLAAAQSPTPPEAMEDAELTSVAFIDADTGWAVGDRGAIWHTIDGGRHWQRQDSPTRARLGSVYFQDAETGWAVGGGHRPYTHQGVGVVLRTVDGGHTWQHTPDTNLPAVKQVKFFGPRQGIALGEASALYPSGVYATGDGGRSWSSLAIEGRSAGHWTAGDFLGIQGGLVAGASGFVAAVDGMSLMVDDAATTNHRPHALKIARDGQAWLAGERGLLLRSGDAGQSWSPPANFPQELAAQIDFASVATVGNQVWVTGNPGTQVFHSPDAGRTWETLRTDSSVPLNSIFFLDENRGWAVGLLGTILATRDGGRTWRVQRQSGTRAALLAIFSRPERLPHELIVQQAGNEGYLTAIELLTSDPGERSSGESRAEEAGALLLASNTATSSQFPLPKIMAGASLEQMLAAWDRDEPNAARRLEEHLVRRIRTWRPEVIVTENAHPAGDDPLAHLTNQLVLAATAKAADPQAYPEQIAQAGLAEWRVKKVIASAVSRDAQRSAASGDVKLVCSQLAPRIGASLADVADEARGLIEPNYTIAPGSRGFSILVDHLPQGQGRRDIFSGVALQPGGDARRILSKPPIPDYTALSKQIQKRQLLQGLLERSEKDPLRGQAWLAQVTEMTRGLPPATSCRVMYHLAQRYQASGENELAAEVMTALVEKHPDHPLTDAALLHLIHYFASGETAHRLRKETHFVQPAVAELEETGRSARPTEVIRPASANMAKGVATQPIEPNARLERAIVFGKLLERNRPMLFAEPSVRFTQVNARTKSASSSLERQRQLQSVAALPGSAWSECAKAELWIAGRGDGACPKRNFLCKSVSSKPVLDGRLDDEVWQSARPVSLRETTSAAQKPLDAIVALTHDDEFLYLAVSCQRSPDLTYKATERVRPRDADLTSHDRVEVLLDIDRDYATCWRLVVDHRGWTNESCFDDPSWNPEWFVAAAGDDTHWTVEAAIPLAELTADKTLKNQPWAVGLQRVLPAVGLQSWTPEAELDLRPEAFGLMQWE